MGKARWIVKHSIALLHYFGHPAICYERYAHSKGLFVARCSFIRRNWLEPLFN
jgi:hypothetical protein